MAKKKSAAKGGRPRNKAARKLLGNWRSPEGNVLVAHMLLAAGSDMPRGLRFAWSRPPSPGDMAFYNAVVAAELAAVMPDYVKIPPGKTLLVTREE